MYVSADGTGVPMVPEELVGRKGKQADGKAKTRQAYLGCVFTPHRVDEAGHPVRDWESTTYVSGFMPIDEFGPFLRQEALRRGYGTAVKVVLLIDGATGLENMGKLAFKDCIQIVDFFHAMEHAGLVLEALIGKAHYFIGSGVVEAGCKTVIGGRCKQSGMFWSEAGAENILALRCINSSRRLDEF